MLIRRVSAAWAGSAMARQAGRPPYAYKSVRCRAADERAVSGPRRADFGDGLGGGRRDLTDIQKTLWAAADKLRGSMDAAEYKHVVLGLIFLKYVSDAFSELRAQLETEIDEGADPDDVDEYRWRNVFWVPAPARWGVLAAQARQPNIGSIIDRAMDELEAMNPALDGVLPKDYARPALDQERLGQLIDLLGNVTVGDAAARSRDVLGRVYEYFLSMFADAEGKRGGEFYTPRCVVRLLVEMIEPFEGRVYDPCCGSSGMFVQSVEFIEAHATGNGNGGSTPRGTRTDISIYGQESNYTTWRLARMNLAIRGIEGQITHGDTFHDDRHPRPASRLHLGQPAVQCVRLGRRPPDRRQALALRHAAEGQRQLRLGAAHGSTTSRRRGSPASCWPTVRCRRGSRARARSARTSSKPIWSTAWWPCPASCSSPQRSRHACGSWRRIAPATTACATAAAKSCSSTPADWAAWWTAPTANSPTTTSPR